MAVNWKAFVDQIAHYQSFILVSHIRPDCDALGSELGMAEVLRAQLNEGMNALGVVEAEALQSLAM